VHARAEEEKFAADAFGVERYPMTYNDIRLIDPKSNPAGIKGMEDVAEAFKAIKAKATRFMSCDDRPGTHTAGT
jgi:tungstate transport system substrate-binding protein